MSGGAVVGIDIGGTKLLALRGDGEGEPLRLPAPREPREAVATIRAAVSALAGEEVQAVGVGVPCLVDADGRLRFSAHLPGLVGLDLCSALSVVWPAASVWVGNDATAAGWAEVTAGAARGRRDVLMVTLGTGIGGGIVAGGRLVEGTHRFAGEWGHMVVDPHGPPCPCGQRGCWERFASGGGLGRLGREAAIAGRAGRLVELAGGDPEAVRGEHVTAAAAEGDPGAVAVMGELSWWLALGIANLVNILDPELVVVGGGLVDAGELLFAPLRAALASLVEASSQRGRVEVVPAQLGSLAGAAGAAMLAGGAAEVV